MMRSTLLIASLAIVAGLAGCASPSESNVDDNVVDDGTGFDDTNDNPFDIDDRTGSSTPEFLMIDGETYECDDTIDLDGICDGYELNEGNAGDGTMETVTASNGQITVGGYTYTCDNIDMVDVDVVDDTNTAGKCERYDRDE